MLTEEIIMPIERDHTNLVTLSTKQITKKIRTAMKEIGNLVLTMLGLMDVTM